MDKKKYLKKLVEHANKRTKKNMQDQSSDNKKIQIVMKSKSIFNQFDNDSLDLYRKIKGGRFT